MTRTKEQALILFVDNVVGNITIGSPEDKPSIIEDCVGYLNNDSVNSSYYGFDPAIANKTAVLA